MYGVSLCFFGFLFNKMRVECRIKITSCFNFKVNGCHDKCSFNEPASDGAATHVPPAKGSVGAVSRLSLWDTGDVACP